MINKNNYRAAFAGAAPNGSACRNTEFDNGISYSAASSETDDFNGFTSSHQPHRNSSGSPRRPQQKKRKVYEINLKTILIIAASVLAFVLLVIAIVAIANSNGGNITKENNTFTSFEKEGLYYVAVNGDVVEPGFENTIELVPAADNSFAYVIETTAEQKKLIHVLEKKELIPITVSPVTSILALAELEPGIVYRDGEIVNFYADENEQRIIKNVTADNFVIAADASAVAFTASDDENAVDSKLYVHVQGVRESCASNMIPVAISKGGKYIYAYGISSEDYVSKKLYLIDPIEQEKTPIETGFNSITYTNIKCDEILYTVGSPDTGYKSYIFSAKKEESFEIGAGLCVPMHADESVVKLATLKGSVLENVYFFEGGERSNSATYYVDKSYKPHKVSPYNGKLNGDGDTFYYIGEEDTLYSIDLSAKKYKAKSIAIGVSDFVITAKDNVYILDDEMTLLFYKSSTAKKRTVGNDVEAFSYNSYSNVLYFEVLNDEKVYFTEEGSGLEPVEFSKEAITSAPVFISEGQKRTFVSVFNTDTGMYDLYYTTTGKSFKSIEEDCSRIGNSIPALEQQQQQQDQN